MTGRAAALQGGLAALSLVAVHFTWQREPERAPGEVTVLDASKTDVASVHYEDDNAAVDLTRQSGGSEPTVWMHVVEKKAPPAPPVPKDPKDPKAAAPPPKAPVAPPPRDLLGNEGAVKLYERFTPLQSPRAFGVLDAAKLKEIGFGGATKRKLEVVVKGDTRQFEIGQSATTVSGESFLRDTRDGRVYLMPRGMLGELQNASHLVERKLHKFEMADYDRIVVTLGSKHKELMHLGREAYATEAFAPAKTPDKRDQMAKNWHDALWRQFPVEVLGKGELPAEGAPKTVLRVDYYDGKSEVGFIEIAKSEGPASITSDEPPAASDFYARTEHTVGWAKLHSAQQIMTDAEKVVAP